LWSPKVLDIGEGELIPGDGAVYYDVRFEAVVLRLALQEVIEGVVVETTSFGALRQPRPHRCHAPREPDIR